MPRIRFVHFAAPPISRLIARPRSCRGRTAGDAAGQACERQSSEGRREEGRGRPGWLGPAGKRIAAREPPKLDYSCHATLNGVTHVRDDRDPVASRGRTAEHVSSTLFHLDRIRRADGRMDGWMDRWMNERYSVSRSPEKFRFNLETADCSGSACPHVGDRHGVHEVSRRLPLIMPAKALASLQLTHSDDDDHR